MTAMENAYKKAYRVMSKHKGRGVYITMGKDGHIHVRLELQHADGKLLAVAALDNNGSPAIIEVNTQ